MSDSATILKADMGFYTGIVFGLLLKPPCKIHVRLALQEY